MNSLRKSVVQAAAIALPVETVNCFLLAFPIDVGLPPDAGWFTKLLGLEWVLIHLPGLWLNGRIDAYGYDGHAMLVIFTGGYLDTALLLFLAIVGARWIRGLSRKPPAMPAESTER